MEHGSTSWQAPHLGHNHLLHHLHQEALLPSLPGPGGGTAAWLTVELVHGFRSWQLTLHLEARFVDNWESGKSPYLIHPEVLNSYIFKIESESQNTKVYIPVSWLTLSHHITTFKIPQVSLTRPTSNFETSTSSQAFPIASRGFHQPVLDSQPFSNFKSQAGQGKRRPKYPKLKHKFMSNQNISFKIKFIADVVPLFFFQNSCEDPANNTCIGLLCASHLLVVQGHAIESRKCMRPFLRKFPRFPLLRCPKQCTLDDAETCRTHEGIWWVSGQRRQAVR